jgi:hypothetical protein
MQMHWLGMLTRLRRYFCDIDAETMRMIGAGKGGDHVMTTPVPSSGQGKKLGLAGVSGVSLSILPLILGMVASAYAAPVVDPANGHTYEFIQQAVTWDAARAAAAGAGRSCHLATITSQAENDFVVDLLPPSDDLDDIWLGGQRKTSCTGSDSASNWGIWITGESWSYTNWKSDEPDECTDDCLSYTSTGSTPPYQWGTDECSNQDFYVVECEPTSAAPALSESAIFVLWVLLTASGWWVLRRRATKAR